MDPDSRRITSRLELRVAVIDDLGYRAPIPVIPIEMRIASPPQPGEMGQYETMLRLRRRPHRGVIAIYDPASGRVLSREIEIVVRR